MAVLAGIRNMFRIVQIKVPYDVIMEAYERNSYALERLQGIVKLHVRRLRSERADFDTDFFVSEPMATTSATFFEAEQYLRSMFGDPPHLFVDLTKDYKLLRTRAPQAYDYGYVIEVGTVQGESEIERLVAMPRERVEYQSGRYSSGLYTPIDCS